MRSLQNAYFYGFTYGYYYFSRSLSCPKMEEKAVK